MATTKAKSAKKTRARKKAKQFLVDEKGRRTAVVLPIEDYEELIEAIEQREDIRRLEAGDKIKGEDISWEEMKAKLRAEGKLP
jgi:PHD/YefM family antitoxin component YafN of YafNO toxin-antitoxin module